MSDVKEKHPTWFKMKIERRQLVKQLEPKTAVNVLLACWDYLETGEYPTNLSALEQIAWMIKSSGWTALAAWMRGFGCKMS